MKYTFGVLLLMSQLVWAAPHELKFVSTLSSPVGSFKEIVAKDTDVVTKFEGSTEINLGSQKAGGNIELASGGTPFEIDTVLMEEGTTFAVQGDNKWLVSNLYIGTNGSVAPQSVHAFINNDRASSTTINIDSNGVLIIPPVAYVSSASSSDQLEAGSFKFTDSTSSGTAGFEQLACNEKNKAAGLCNLGTSIKVLRTN